MLVLATDDLHTKEVRPKFENKSSAVVEMGDRAGAVGRKVKAGCCAPSVEELGSHITQCRLGRGVPPYQVAS